MRSPLLMAATSALLLSFSRQVAIAQTAPIIEPTPEPLEATIKAFAKIGARLSMGPHSPVFTMSRLAKNFDLQKIPAVPFSFGLSLGSDVTDAEMQNLARLHNLTWLSVYSKKVTDKGLKPLAHLTNLASLDLLDANITDAGLKELSGLENLKELNLSGTKVTDAGLLALAALRNLTSLDIEETQVTEAGERDLQKALLKCKIKR